MYTYDVATAYMMQQHEICEFSLINSLIRSLTHSFTHSLSLADIRPFIHSIMKSLVRPFPHTIINSIIHSFLYTTISLLNNSSEMETCVKGNNVIFYFQIIRTCATRVALVAKLCLIYLHAETKTKQWSEDR